jgi:hypothetical protein
MPSTTLLKAVMTVQFDFSSATAPEITRGGVSDIFTKLAPFAFESGMTVSGSPGRGHGYIGLFCRLPFGNFLQVSGSPLQRSNNLFHLLVQIQRAAACGVVQAPLHVKVEGCRMPLLVER